MSEKPATDAAKPGSKLAQMRALGAGGFARQIERVAAAILPKQPPPIRAPAIAQPKAKEPPMPMPLPPEPAHSSNPPKRKPIEKVKPRQGKPGAREAAKTALAEAVAEAAELKTLKETKPWEKMDPPISRATYFNRRKAGLL